MWFRCVQGEKSAPVPDVWKWQLQASLLIHESRSGKPPARELADSAAAPAAASGPVAPGLSAAAAAPRPLAAAGSTESA